MKDSFGEVTMKSTIMEERTGIRASRKISGNELEAKFDTRLPFPDMGEAEKSRRARTRKAMEAINPSLAHKIIPQERALTREDKAAIDIQRIFRGYLARKQFVELLYEKYMQEEEEMEEKRRQQVEEGEILVENYHLEHELEDKATIRRNRVRSADANATTIQRAWRTYKRHQEGKTIPDEPIDLGRAEDGYNEAEFPYIHESLNYRMRNYEDRETHGVDINYIYDDSLENADVISDDGCSDRSDLSEIARSFPGDYLIDNEFSGEFESMGSRFNHYDLSNDFRTKCYVEPTLPEPTTDWDTIESVLTNESGVNSPEDGDIDDEDLSQKLSTGPNLQLCFVDDDGEGTDNDSDAEVKVYIVDDERNMEYLNENHKSMSSGDLLDEREIDSRDSGCVPGDLVDLNIDYVTDYTPNQLSQGPLPSEESKRVLYSLQLHEEHEVSEKEKVEEKKRKSLAPNSVYLKTVEELKFLRRELEDKVQLVSNELVESLMARDNLHAAQEALLMEVEDLSKLAQNQHQLQALKNTSKF